MKYADMVREAKKNDSLEKITSVFKKDWKKGEVLTGRLMSMEPIENEKMKSKYFSYLFNTDEGNVKTALGAGVDREVRPFMEVGRVYIITFKGTEDIGKGREMKRFEIVHVALGEEAEVALAGPSETGEELPF